MIRPAPEKTSLSTRPHPGQLALKMLGCTCLLASLVLGCGSKQPKEEDYDLEIPTAEVLYEDGLEALKPKRVMLIFPYTNHQKAIDIFQEIVDNYPYSDYSIKAELQIANAYYDQKKWEEALSYYRDFGDLHPDDDQVPYALYQTGMCYSNQVSVPDRDQRATHYAVEAFQDLIDSYPDSGYAIEAVELEHALRVRLAENSFILADFYFETEEYQAASRRFEIMLIEYPDLGFDPLVLQRLGISYARLNRTEKSAAAFERLRTEYGVDERGVSVSAEAP